MLSSTISKIGCSIKSESQCRITYLNYDFGIRFQYCAIGLLSAYLQHVRDIGASHQTPDFCPAGGFGPTFAINPARDAGFLSRDHTERNLLGRMPGHVKWSISYQVAFKIDAIWRAYIARRIHSNSSPSTTQRRGLSP